MPTRTRSRTANISGEYKSTAASSKLTYNRETRSDVCTDWIGNLDGDNALSLVQRHCEGGILDGIANPLESTHPSYWKCPVNNWRPLSPPPSLLTGGPASDDSARAIATTNPSRPDVLLPAFVAELRDIPRLVKYGAEIGKFLVSPSFRRSLGGPSRLPPNVDASRLISWVKPSLGNGLSATKQIAVANLSLQFGVLPFLGDIVKMSGLLSSVEKRRKELDRLYSGSGLRRRVTLDERSDREVLSNQNIMTLGRTFQRTTTSIRTYHRWAVIRYKPTNASPLPPSDDHIARMLLGLTFDSIGSVAWELLPWSWLADYFGNVGDIVKARNNHLQTRYTGTIMTERTASAYFPGATFFLNGSAGRQSKYTMSSGRRKDSVKERHVIGLALLPSFGLPILGSRQLSILSSIFATRAIR